jgi:Spy/CpxP family protein refolding chaperone
MFGVVLGAVALFCVLGFIKARRFGRGWHHHHGHRGGWHRGGWDRDDEDDDRPRRRRRGDGFFRATGEVVKRRLKVDEEQEGIVDLALTDLREAVSGFREVLNDSRTEIASAFRGSEVDQAALDAVFARHDEELARTRREVVSALKQIHAVLDPEQREAAVGWLGGRHVFHA